MFVMNATDTIRGICTDGANRVTYTISGMELASNVETYKILAQGQLASSISTIYTAPSNTQTFVKSLHLANTQGSTSTCRIYMNGTAGSNIVSGLIVIPANGWATIEEDGWRVYDANGRLQMKIVNSTWTIDIQTFTADGTWTKPAGAVFSHVKATGGGASGGSGRRVTNNSTARSGGSGGAGGGIMERWFPSALLGSTEPVTVGAQQTTVGSAQTVNDTNGNAGSDGNDSIFGTPSSMCYVRARGGGAGQGGSSTSVARGTYNSASQGGVIFGNDGGVGDITNGQQGNTGGNAFSVYKGPGGGGGGAGQGAGSSSNTTGGAGGKPFSVAAGVAGGTGAAAAGTNATNPGEGGGGGGAGAGAGGTGGDGAAPGGGGGGGGAGVGANSGAGGRGARGEVVVTTWCLN